MAKILQLLNIVDPTPTFETVNTRLKELIQTYSGLKKRKIDANNFFSNGELLAFYIWLKNRIDEYLTEDSFSDYLKSPQDLDRILEGFALKDEDLYDLFQKLTLKIYFYCKVAIKLPFSLLESEPKFFFENSQLIVRILNLVSHPEKFLSLEDNLIQFLKKNPLLLLCSPNQWPILKVVDGIVTSEKITSILLLFVAQNLNKFSRRLINEIIPKISEKDIRIVINETKNRENFAEQLLENFVEELLFVLQIFRENELNDAYVHLKESLNDLFTMIKPLTELLNKDFPSDLLLALFNKETINFRDSNGYPPIYHLIQHKNYALLKLFLEAGAHPNVLTGFFSGRTLLECAESKNLPPDIMELLYIYEIVDKIKQDHSPISDSAKAMLKKNPELALKPIIINNSITTLFSYLTGIKTKFSAQLCTDLFAPNLEIKSEIGNMPEQKQIAGASFWTNNESTTVEDSLRKVDFDFKF